MLLYLQDPNIVRLMDYFEEEEYYVILTEMHGALWKEVTSEEPKSSTDGKEAEFSAVEPEEIQEDEASCDLLGFLCASMIFHFL